MADGDAKPGDKKEAPKESSFFGELFFFDTAEWIVIGIIFLAAAIRVERFFAASTTAGSASQFTSWLSARPEVSAATTTARLWFAEIYRSFTAVSTGFSVLLVAVIGYVTFRLTEVRKELRLKLYPPKPVSASPAVISSAPSVSGIPVPANLPTGLAGGTPADFPQFATTTRSSQAPNPRWKQVLAHIGSDNPSDWRLAILEADIVLEETLDRAGYIGETLGDKLKNAERRPFNSLNAAWEAHKIRNAIAHQGQGFELNQREASHAVSLFEGVFREFGSV